MENNTFTKRLIVLVILLTAGFSAMWVLPRDGDRRLSCLSPELPSELGNWVGESGRPAEKELRILAKDTEFSRMLYHHPDKPSVEVSVVFSGRDINNSIHRPERCMTAQGWNFIKERKVVVKGALADGGDVALREIVCKKPAIDENRNPVILANGKQRYDYRIQYYTFFGASTIIEGHYGRALTDMKDRLFGGFDQQWAYATFSVPVMGEYAKQGIGVDPKLSHFGMEETEELLSEVISELLPLVVDVHQ